MTTSNTEQNTNSNKCMIIGDDVKSEYRAEIPNVVDTIVESCSRKACFEHVDAAIIPSRDAVIEIIDITRRILYPGYFENQVIDRANLSYQLGGEVNDLFEKLSKQITNSIMHDCQRYGEKCSQCHSRGKKEALDFLKKIPELREVLASDILAAYEGDPAAKCYDEIIFSYPGVLAVTIYRIAHELYKQNITILPRIMTEYAHSIVGIDIHPGAEIGEHFFIDHGTGVVIGETCQIGDSVRIYQGVTLGAMSFPKDETGNMVRGHKRHPTIKDDVIIYAGATILGGDTVIGERSVIGGNVWLTKSVPPDNTVIIEEPKLIYKKHRK
ncbi:Serine O-acetyltransferase [Methanohalobium evestigatum Z-7303]|uniref:Serine O-acetyltransferase n=1 Tax=Methanohalobium evestigatum (strain ATCC BAA-1072 / DSM 3721 / NBRC 107634 / OCM 161 / Z-7303) TaxID=644295 RepID=D7EA38_METEZ|nr:serine O-acetyltransferase EpsC [Methanohalobium evestigatum]ADI74709.1 Serine O-acetyltransferase [Methanohalobium evestigatum Z-7303]